MTTLERKGALSHPADDLPSRETVLARSNAAPPAAPATPAAGAIPVADAAQPSAGAQPVPPPAAPAGGVEVEKFTEAHFTRIRPSVRKRLEKAVRKLAYDRDDNTISLASLTDEAIDKFLKQHGL